MPLVTISPDTPHGKEREALAELAAAIRAIEGDDARLVSAGGNRYNVSAETAAALDERVARPRQPTRGDDADAHTVEALADRAPEGSAEPAATRGRGSSKRAGTSRKAAPRKAAPRKSAARKSTRKSSR